MSKLYKPIVILLLVSVALILFCFLNTGMHPEEVALETNVPAREVSALATELLWDTFSHQFVSGGY